jgi:hypothetical protein
MIEPTTSSPAATAVGRRRRRGSDKHVCLAALVWAALAVQVGAQAPSPELTPDQRAAWRMDRYFLDPTGVPTFRALSGRGDPDADAQPGGVEISEETRNLYVRLFPETSAEDWRYGVRPWRGMPSYDTCRLSYGVETLRERIARLGAQHPYVEQWIEVQRTVYWPCLHPPLPSWVSLPQAAPPAGPAPTRLPPPLQTNDPAVARLQAADRAYQAAAFAFYRDDVQAALGGFQRVGADHSSPHRPSARYMVAAIHAGSRAALFNWDAEPLAPLPQVIREIQAILADPSLSSVHALAQELMGWVRANTNDAATSRAHIRNVLAALEAPIDVLRADPDAKARYDAALRDLPHLHSQFEDPTWFLNAGPPADYHLSRAMMEAARSNDLAAWVLLPAPPLRDADSAGATWTAYATIGDPRLSIGQRVYGGPHWRRLQDFIQQHQDGDGVAWRVAANGYSAWGFITGCDWVQDLASRARAGDEAAAAQLGFDFYDQVRWNLMQHSRGNTSVRQGFHDAMACMQGFPFPSIVLRSAARDGLRYLMSVGRLDEARQWRDAFATQLTDAGQLLLLLAEDEDHLVPAIGDAPPPTGGYGGEVAKERLLNMLSIDALWRLARREDLHDGWRALFARVAWTRTYALGRVIEGGDDRLMRRLNPEITSGWRSRAGRAVRPGDRKVLLDVLRSPGLNLLITLHNRGPASPTREASFVSIDTFQHSDNNWWCRWETDRHDAMVERLLLENFFPNSGALALDATGGFSLRAQLRTMLNGSYVVRQQDLDEQEALSRIDCAPKMLSERVIAWARRPGWFAPRNEIAEALALAVRTTRWGCQRDGGHGAYSRAAFELLHRRFRDTDAARRTRYWYDCAHFTYGCPGAL